MNTPVAVITTESMETICTGLTLVAWYRSVALAAVVAMEMNTSMFGLIIPPLNIVVNINMYSLRLLVETSAKATLVIGSMSGYVNCMS